MGAGTINLTAVKVNKNSGSGSIMTSTSDIERMERLMNQAQHSSKSIIKYFGKHLEEFRREQVYSREIVLSDVISV